MMMNLNHKRLFYLAFYGGSVPRQRFLGNGERNMVGLLGGGEGGGGGVLSKVGLAIKETRPAQPG